ncbi:hypothetical protein ES319_A02G132200v1 [Gossypium barbadense]|uniref:Ras-related protein RHN1 isoform X1 n=4 Tax=Gossypium TaxID=3633 RepID=A0A1U8NUP8_GOSHI|nr:ras-related protein RHN1 isoform X1 [Gossypium hirsutum]KAB2094059.1 hypothetical protein ES319_A02G132200v1 [Gossypium barbadense]
MARPGTRIIQAKLVLVGDMGTGKTSLVLRFVKGQFFHHQEATVGAAFFTQILSVSEATVKFDIWDTAGQERYHSLAPMYYRGAAAAIVVYDISTMDTFARAKKWVQELQKQGEEDAVMTLSVHTKLCFLDTVPDLLVSCLVYLCISCLILGGNPKLVMALVGNKSDLDSKREVQVEEGEEFAQENGMLFMETSAKTAENVNELFYEIAKKLATASPPNPSGVTLNHDETQERRGKLFCCIG